MKEPACFTLFWALGWITKVLTTLHLLGLVYSVVDKFVRNGTFTILVITIVFSLEVGIFILIYYGYRRAWYLVLLAYIILLTVVVVGVVQEDFEYRKRQQHFPKKWFRVIIIEILTALLFDTVYQPTTKFVQTIQAIIKKVISSNQ